MESQSAPPERKAPRDIAPKKKAYAFERSLGIPPAEACRRVGGKVANGDATKWERSPRVQAWIGHYRSLGNTDEMLAAKRARLEERLELAAYGNLLQFATIEDMPVLIGVTEGGDPITKLVKKPVIDWEKVAASPYGVIVSDFKFDKDTGHLTDFGRDSADRAIAQIRDMHGFKAPAKLNLGGRVETDVTIIELVPGVAGSD